MSEGTVTATFVIVFRETLEAGLIVGIVLSMLSRLKAMRYGRHVWLSVVVAVGASLIAGWGLSLATQETQGKWEKIIEGVISLAACGVVTWMVFWMDAQSRRIRPAIETRMEAAVNYREHAVIILLPFLAVLREGAETALFLKAVAIQSSSVVSLWGGLLGGSLAILVTVMIFIGGRRIPLRALFRSTGFLLLVIAAGLLAYGIHELQELGWIPMLVYPVWDINHILNEKEGIGSFLKALFGYNGNPSLIELVSYLIYLIGVGAMLGRWRSKPPKDTSSGPEASGAQSRVMAPPAPVPAETS